MLTKSTFDPCICSSLPCCKVGWIACVFDTFFCCASRLTSRERESFVMFTEDFLSSNKNVEKKGGNERHK